LIDQAYALAGSPRLSVPRLPEPLSPSPRWHHRGSTRNLNGVDLERGLYRGERRIALRAPCAWERCWRAAPGGVFRHTRCSSLPPAGRPHSRTSWGICDRRGGWWPGNLSRPLCEDQTASQPCPVTPDTLRPVNLTRAAPHRACACSFFAPSRRRARRSAPSGAPANALRISLAIICPRSASGPAPRSPRAADGPASRSSRDRPGGSPSKVRAPFPERGADSPHQPAAPPDHPAPRSSGRLAAQLGLELARVPPRMPGRLREAQATLGPAWRPASNASGRSRRTGSGGGRRPLPAFLSMCSPFGLAHRPDVRRIAWYLGDTNRRKP